MLYSLAMGALLFMLALPVPSHKVCFCAITLMTFLDKTGGIQVQDAYSLPVHCSAGSFYIFEKKRVIQLNWIKQQYVHTVNIPLPPPSIVGHFQIYYCWGEKHAIVGNQRVSVYLVTKSMRLT